MMSQKVAIPKIVAIAGAGPAGLTAALELVERGVRAEVFEAHSIPGGIARTEVYRGFRFDMGGHRFFTKSRWVADTWRRVLGNAFVLRPRLSRIYYNSTFFDYPLKPFDALWKLGLVESTIILLSYARVQIFRNREERTFRAWVSNRFGDRLFETFFKTYTEKVWGISTDDLSADWAAQRIKRLDLKSALLSPFVKPRRTITSLIEQFHYPIAGPGMMWEAFVRLVRQRGGAVEFNSEVTRIKHNARRVESVVVRKADGEQRRPCDALISTMSLPDLIERMDPPAPAEVRAAASRLRFRSFLTVCLIVDRPHLFPDNWIYVHDPGVQVGRIQNFKNWSPGMLPDQRISSLGLEYFCDENDEVWCRDDAALLEQASQELEILRLAERKDIVDGVVYRVRQSYPVYDQAYQDHVAVIRTWLAGFSNLKTIGRNGLHRYNNQDHSMLTAKLAVQNLLLGEERHDVWSVNAESEYHEETEAAIRGFTPPGRNRPAPALNTV